MLQRKFLNKLQNQKVLKRKLTLEFTRDAKEFHSNFAHHLKMMILNHAAILVHSKRNHVLVHQKVVVIVELAQNV